MRVLIEVQNGSVVDVAADGECEVIVVDRDDVGTLPDGTSGLASLWRYSSDSVPTLLMGGDRFTGWQADCRSYRSDSPVVISVQQPGQQAPAATALCSALPDGYGSG